MIEQPTSTTKPAVPWPVLAFEKVFDLPWVRSRKNFFSKAMLKPFQLFFLMLMVPLIIYSRVRIFSKKIFGLRPSLVYGPTPIVNIGPNSQLDRLMGYRSETLVYTTYHLTSDFTYSLKEKFQHDWLRPYIPYLCFVFAYLRFDIFQYYYDWGLLDWANIVRRGKEMEYRFLKWGGKRLIFSAYGSDVRTRELTLKMPINLCRECPPNEIGTHCICDESKGQKNFNFKSKFASAILSMGDMLEYTPGSDNSVFYWPIDIQKWPYVGVTPGDQSQPLVVVHAPNHPQLKGTKYLYAACDQLKAEGLHIDLRVVRGLSNSEAKKIYASADVIAAQFVAGWHGYFEIEAMALGKPTMVCIRNEDYLLAPQDCPLIRSCPEEIADQLRDFYFNRSRLVEIGERSRAYVEKYYSFEATAPRFQKLYDRVW